MSEKTLEPFLEEDPGMFLDPVQSGIPSEGRSDSAFLTAPHRGDRSFLLRVFMWNPRIEFVRSAV